MMNEQTFAEISSSYLTVEEEKRKKNDIKFEESDEDHLLSQNTTESSIPANVQNSNTKKEDKNIMETKDFIEKHYAISEELRGSTILESLSLSIVEDDKENK